MSESKTESQRVVLNLSFWVSFHDALGTAYNRTKSLKARKAMTLLNKLKTRAEAISLHGGIA